MKIIKQYLAREVYTTLLVVVAVLMTVFLSHQFVRFMQMVAKGSLPGQAIKIALLLQFPMLLAFLLPVSLFLAILLAYGRLYADNEMTILSACGISPEQLLKTTLKFLGLVMVVVAILSLWINPKIYRYSDRILSGAVSKTVQDIVKPHTFTSISKDSMVFYVDAVSKSKNNEDQADFSKVFVAQQPESNKLVTAKKAYQKVDSKTGDIYLVLLDGYRYVGTPGQKDYEVIKYDEYVVRSVQEAAAEKVDASSKSTKALWHDRSDPVSAAELHWRLAFPISALILTLIGTPLSKIRPRQGRYAKLVPAILLYITYVNLLFLAKAWLKSGMLSPVLGMWWVHGGLMMFVVVFLMGRNKE